MRFVLRSDNITGQQEGELELKNVTCPGFEQNSVFRHLRLVGIKIKGLWRLLDDPWMTDRFCRLLDLSSFGLLVQQDH